ncbi:MAG: DUF2782 domain-containing protein [Proteobacteria bacterium]|nr:DUF2782 domain-containing protein [Pseudomonadota bacterium]
MKRHLLSLILLFATSVVMAGNTNPGGLEPVPEPPDLPDPLETGETIEPQVTIIRKEDATIEEYRINGALYMVKVTPAVGPAYYMIDNDGDGRMDLRRSDLDDVIVPQWVLFTW